MTVLMEMLLRWPASLLTYHSKSVYIPLFLCLLYHRRYTLIIYTYLFDLYINMYVKVGAIIDTL